MERAGSDLTAFGETVVFLDYFKDLPDPRQAGKVIYPLPEVLLLCLLAVLAGAETFVDIARFGEKKIALLRRFRPFRHGTPAHDSLHWVMDMVFRDDECRVRTDQAPANFTTLKHMAPNLIRKAPGRRHLSPTRSCVTATNGSEVQGMIARIIFALWILPAASLAWAHDDIHDQWYESLTVPGTTNGCCNGYDCKPTEAEIRDNQWWARGPDGKWIEVPENAVIEDKGNPVG